MNESASLHQTEVKVKKQSQVKEIIRRLMKNKMSMIGLIMLCLLIIIAVFAPVFAPYDPSYMDFANCYGTPSLQHPFGCDSLGRDLLSRIMYGGRYSLFLGFSASILGAVLGVVLGAPVGYFGGKVDMFVLRACDVIQAIPSFLLCILISASFGAGFINTIFAMVIGSIPNGIRNTRSMSLKEREMEYLEAAKSINCSPLKIIYRHMTPNIIAPTIVQTTMGIGGSIMMAASLSYIGMGVQPPTPEWGAMLSDGRAHILTYPHLLIFPGLAICVTIIAINMFGDGLRDAMDPKLKD